ncbi:hypothetical protein [Streptomyces sp. NPDC057695]
MEKRADLVADAAREPADAVAAGTWSPTAVEDAIDAVETIA